MTTSSVRECQPGRASFGAFLRHRRCYVYNCILGILISALPTVTLVKLPRTRVRTECALTSPQALLCRATRVDGAEARRCIDFGIALRVAGTKTPRRCGCAAERTTAPKRSTAPQNEAAVQGARVHRQEWYTEAGSIRLQRLLSSSLRRAFPR